MTVYECDSVLYFLWFYRLKHVCVTPTVSVRKFVFGGTEITMSRISFIIWCEFKFYVSFFCNWQASRSVNEWRIIMSYETFTAQTVICAIKTWIFLNKYGANRTIHAFDENPYILRSDLNHHYFFSLGFFCVRVQCIRVASEFDRINADRYVFEAKVGAPFSKNNIIDV